MYRKGSWTTWFVVVGLAAAGCGDDGSTAADDGGGTEDVSDLPGEEVADVPGDEGSDGPADDGGGGALVVRVTRSIWPAEGTVPAEGAVVALEGVRGPLGEATTGADGLAAFDEVPAAAWPVSATAWLAGHALASRTGVPADAGEVELALWRADDPDELVPLTGTVAGMAAADNDLTVTVTAPSVAGDAVAPDYALQVAPGVAFDLVVVEAHAGTAPPSGRGVAREVDGWTMVASPALTDPTVLDADLADAATPRTASGSFRLPTRGDSPLRRESVGYLWVSSLASGFGAYLGVPTRTDVTLDGASVEYDLQWVEPPSVEDPVTLYGIFAAGFDAFSRVVVRGWPTEGPHDSLGFLEIPELETPASPAVRHPLHLPIVWRLFNTGVEVSLQILRNDRVVWGVRAERDATTLTVPQAPTGADLEGLLGTGVVEGRLTVFRRDAEDEYSEQVARTGPFVLQL